ncbi:MAG: hypothetical protein H6546_07020 [Chitinophagales bacterium]|nr:hypothetical protein [Chitinophagales bacterium]
MTASSTLTWSVATGNALDGTADSTYPVDDIAVLPAQDPVLGGVKIVTFTYGIQVNSSFAPTTEAERNLTNGAHIEGTLPDDDPTDNDDSQTIRVPDPDPAITKV